MIIRAVRQDDAARLLELQHRLDHETSCMLLEPDERAPDVEHQREVIARIASSSTQVMLVAETDVALAGLIVVSGGAFRRNRRTAAVVTGVAQAFWRRGIGSRLLEAGESWARSRGICRLELTVIAHNHAAIALYRRMGFEAEGTRCGALEIAGRPVDELYMGKLLTGGRP